MGRLFRPRTKNIKASGVLADAKKNIMAVGTRNREMSPPCDVRKHFILILVNIINVFGGIVQRPTAAATAPRQRTTAAAKRQRQRYGQRQRYRQRTTAATHGIGSYSKFSLRTVGGLATNYLAANRGVGNQFSLITSPFHSYRSGDKMVLVALG